MKISSTQYELAKSVRVVLRRLKIRQKNRGPVRVLQKGKSKLPKPKQVVLVQNAPPRNRNNHLFQFRVIRSDAVVYYRVNLLEPLKQPDEYYKCVVTEDLTGKDPKFLFGATEDAFGNIFCIIQFEGADYVEIVLSTILFKKFPTFRIYFEYLCPSLFPKAARL